MGFAQRRELGGQSERNRDFVAVEQDIWFAWHISRGAILKLFEPVEGKVLSTGSFYAPTWNFITTIPVYFPKTAYEVFLTDAVSGTIVNTQTGL